jgi:hypothetical protein
MILDIAVLNRTAKIGVLLAMVIAAYPGAGFPYAWQLGTPIKGYEGSAQINQALKYIDDEQLLKAPGAVLVHQLPELNVRLDLDPWASPEKAKTFYMWSIDKRPGQDWMPKGAVLLWDNFHARRDAPMPIVDLKALPQYRELAQFLSPIDSVYDVRVWIKD